MAFRDTDYVVLEDATFRGPRGPIFAHTTFRLPSDQRWAIRGASGAGKSLFVAAITGRLWLVSGSFRHPFLATDVRCADSTFGVLPPCSIAVASMEQHRALVSGRAFHQLRWHASLASGSPNVADFLTHNAVEDRNPYAVTTAEEKARFEVARVRETERFTVGALLDRPLLALSNGELHRLLLARAMMLDPRLLIVDEPFAGLDLRTRSFVAEILRELPAQGTGVLYVVAREQDVTPDVTHELEVSAGAVVYAGVRRIDRRSRAVQTVAAASSSVRPPQARDTETVLELRGVTVRQGPVTLVANVDWTIRRGERWALVGPNGSGKSTLLSLALADNPQAFSNHVVVGGRRVGPGTSIWDIKRMVGWLSPELEAHYPLGTLALDAVVSGFRSSLGVYTAVSAEELAAGRAWLERLGLGDSSEVALCELSSLERRIALLGRACVHEPQLILLDEPCQGLDTADTHRFAQALESVLARVDAALVYVSHDPGELPPSIDHVFELAGQIERTPFTES